MTTPLLPIPREIRDELLSGLDELDYAYGKTAEAANARQWIRDLEAHWPDMAHVPEGRDVFAQHPVSGEQAGGG